MIRHVFISSKKALCLTEHEQANPLARCVALATLCASIARSAENEQLILSKSKTNPEPNQRGPITARILLFNRVGRRRKPTAAFVAYAMYELCSDDIEFVLKRAATDSAMLSMPLHLWVF